MFCVASSQVSTYSGICKIYDNAITVHRHKSDEEDYAGIHVHKIRFQYKNGRPTNSKPAKLKYDIRRGVYEEYIEEFKEDLFN